MFISHQNLVKKLLIYKEIMSNTILNRQTFKLEALQHINYVNKDKTYEKKYQ